MKRLWRWIAGKDTDLASTRFASRVARRYQFAGLARSYARSRKMFAYVTNSGIATTPDNAAIDITGDIDIRVLCSLLDWSPQDQDKLLITKWNTTGNQRAFRFYMEQSSATRGYPTLDWSTNGASGTVVTLRPGVAVDASAIVGGGGLLWIRVTLDVNNGAANAEVKFYTSPPFATPVWTQLGTTQLAGATTSIFNSSEGLVIGGGVITGGFLRAQILSGIAGSAVFDADFSKQAPGTTSFNDDASGIVVTLNASAVIDVLPED